MSRLWLTGPSLDWKATLSWSSGSFSQCESEFGYEAVGSKWSLVHRSRGVLSSRFGRRVQVVKGASDCKGYGGRKQQQRTSALGTSKSGGARQRRLQKAAEEKKQRLPEPKDNYPEWATILEDACKDDVELREIIGDSFGNPDEMRKRVEDRLRKKGRDVLSPKTGSAVPMVVTFKSGFDPTNGFIWLELYGEPSDKDLETIGSVLTAWYLLGKLGSFNSMNMQLTDLPLNASMNYSTEHANEALPSMFHNIRDLEFQDNWGRFWVDLGTSDPVAMDILINALSSVSTEHVGIKQLVFGGSKLGDWVEGVVDPADGYRSYKLLTAQYG